MMLIKTVLFYWRFGVDLGVVGARNQYLKLGEVFLSTEIDLTAIGFAMPVFAAVVQILPLRCILTSATGILLATALQVIMCPALAAIASAVWPSSVVASS